MPFETDLVISPLDGRRWELREPLRYRGETETWEIPEGFVTDLATVPRFLWDVIPPYGTGVTLAVVVHDYLLDHELPGRTITSRDADGVMRRIMREEHAPWLTRWLMWTGVRWGALVNPRRVYGRGFLRDLPAVFGLSLLFPFVALVPWSWSR